MTSRAGRVAVLMPVYQAQQDFEATMRNLACSTIPATVVVVDDGSTPPLRVPDYGPRLRTHLVRLPRNEGIVGALNAGLLEAIGAGYEFIARLDAGDFTSPDRLAKQVAYLESHPHCMLVGSDAKVRDEDGSYCYLIKPPRDPRLLARAMHERAWLLHSS